MRGHGLKEALPTDETLTMGQELLTIGVATLIKIKKKNPSFHRGMGLKLSPWNKNLLPTLFFGIKLTLRERRVMGIKLLWSVLCRVTKPYLCFERVTPCRADCRRARAEERRLGRIRWGMAAGTRRRVVEVLRVIEISRLWVYIACQPWPPGHWPLVMINIMLFDQLQHHLLEGQCSPFIVVGYYNDCSFICLQSQSKTNWFLKGCKCHRP